MLHMEKEPELDPDPQRVTLVNLSSDQGEEPFILLSRTAFCHTLNLTPHLLHRDF